MSATPLHDRPVLERVWEPLQIGRTTVRNRIMMTAQSASFGKDNLISDRHIEYYRERAKGGAALFICEQQGAHRLSKGSFYEGCTAWEPRSIPQYAKLAEAVHELGARQFVQLFGCGVHDKGTTIMDEWHPLWGVSKIPSLTHREIPMVMEQEHIDDVVRGFGQSALNVQCAGIDGIEVHAAHSYLIGQFMSRAYNKRDDGYGGSVANRTRIALEIGAEIRRRIGPDFTVGIRLSYDELMGDAGITSEESDEMVSLLLASGFYDFFNISVGGYHTIFMAVPPMSTEPGFMVKYARRCKAIVGDKAKVFTVGRILNLYMAEEALRDGACDMVAMTRAQMADPHLVRKTREHREHEIIHCMGANECIARTFDQRPSVCQVNPATGREQHWGLDTLHRVAPEAAKKVVVVGGGIGGMHTAEIAARRGHRVVLFERAAELGGHLNLLKQFPTRQEWNVAIDNLRRGMANHGVDVRLGVTADPGCIGAESPDVVIVATGARWDKDGVSVFKPERDAMPGWQQDNVVDLGTAARRALADPKALGRRVVIWDEAGTYLHLGLADVLVHCGIEVEILTSLDHPGEDALKHFDLFFVMPRLAEAGVRVTNQVAVERIDGKRVYARSIWGGPERCVEAVDTLVLSMLRSPEDALYREIRHRYADVRRVGDCLAPRKPAQVMYEAHETGRAL